jgi:hypothetical protein
MPDFTQWNVPSPFPNILYNPAAVDAVIAKTQSELGNLDINRQTLALEQDKAARDVAFGDYLKKSLPTDGTTGTTGAAAGGGGGSFLSALAQIESGDKNIVSGTDKDNQGLTLAQGGNPTEISQGHFQIHTGTWKDFAPQAGVDINKYPNAMSAPREVQAQVASVIPFKRFGPRTQTMMRQQFGDIDSNRTVGELAGLGPRAGSAAVAGPVAVAPPPATQQAGALPAPPIPPGNPNAGPRIGLVPPSAVATTPPPAQTGQADDPNMAAVKQASTALLAMPEPDAAAAYPAVVKELQARGFAMQAPPTYPGHAALQALVGGGDPTAAAVEPSRVAMRTGGTDTAGPGAGQATVPPDVQPNRLAYGTNLPGVTIGLPGNGLAPPPTAAAPPSIVTAAAPAQAQPQAAAPTQPPPAPSRVIQREPLIQSGIFAGLTRTQASTIANTPGVKPATIMEQIATARHQNDVIRQGDATQAAIDEKESYARRHTAEQEAQAAADKKEAQRVAAENLRLSQEGGARDAERLAIERKKFEQGPDAQSRDAYTLKNADPSSQDYAEAWAHKKWTVAPNGNVIENDVSQYPAPTRSIQRPSFLPAPTPQALDEVRKADTDAKVITSGIDHYIDVHTAVGANNWDAFINNPRSPQAQQLLGAFDRMKTVLRSPVYFNTGVLQPAEMAMMKEDLTSPQTLRGLFATPEALATRLGEIKLAILTRQDAELRSIGKPGVIVRDKSDLAGVPVGGRYYDEDGHLRVKQEQK